MIDFVAMETWRAVTIEGLESLYEVSDLGRVRRSAPGKGTFPGRILKLTHGHGRNASRCSVSLKPLGEPARSHLVHHLVALAFIGDPPGRIGQRRGTFQINHLDGNPSNNRADNLEWCTSLQNHYHARVHGLIPTLRGEEASAAVMTEARVLEARQRFRQGERCSDLAGEFGLTRGGLMQAIHGYSWPHLPGAAKPGDRILKLTADQVRIARGRAANGEPVARIARDLGVNYSTLLHAVRGDRCWMRLGAGVPPST